jgi:hypothetical protein
VKRSSSRRPFILVTWLVGLLLLLGSGQVALHQHEDEAASHSCAVCGAAHASAIPLLVAAASAPRLVSSHGVTATVVAEPPAALRGPGHSRAPPTS